VECVERDGACQLNVEGELMAVAKYQWWQRYGNAAQITSAAVAIFGFAAVLLQLNEIRSNNRAASARQVYLAYMDLEFRNPQLAVPDYDRIKAGDRETRLRYESFVSYLLYACEEAMAAFGTQGEWRNSCEYDLKGHLLLLCEKLSADPAFFGTFSTATQDFIKSALMRAGMESPACKAKPV
jgi:hypothetical protein